MKTVVLQIDDLIFDKVVTLLRTFPTNQLNMRAADESSAFVSATEQRDIEQMLRDPDCFAIEHATTVTI